MHITFIQTGGTIDKDYPRILNSYAFEISEPAVKRILEKTSPNFTYEILECLKKDSTEITEEDRKKILDLCQKTKNEYIIITHGTDTMIKTAEYLSKITDKTIVLTGSILPEKFVDSDAMFNVGCAIGALSYLPKGVYIAMSGRVYRWDKCYKSEDCVFIEK